MLFALSFAFVLSVLANGPTSVFAASAESAAAAAVSPPANCDKGYLWRQKVNGCYKIQSGFSHWDNAKTACEAEGGDLLVINNEAEADSVFDILALFGYTNWRIGVRDFENNGTYTSVNGEPFSSLYQGKTQDIEEVIRRDQCLYLSPERRIFSSGCYFSWPSICEKNL